MSKIKIDQIIRSGRQTLSLEIAPDARLIVRAPFKVKINRIEKALFEKRFWIEAKQRLTRQRRLEIHPKAFVAGESFLYMGKAYKLEIVCGASPLRLGDRFYLSEKHSFEGRQEFIRWYKEQAFITIGERVQWYTEAFGLQYKSMTISNATRRWGSCSGKGKLRFSWRLVLAPLKVVDYVVVHELVHLEEKNHARAFWRKVQGMLPGYKKQVVWLKDNQHLLTL